MRVLAHASSKDIQPINHQPSFSQSQSQLHFRPPLKRQKATQFIDFGVFSSFAPNCDSSRAELSVMETSLGLKRKYMVVYENVEDSTETGDDIHLMNDPLHAFDGTKAITDLNFVDVVAVKEGKDESSCIPDKNGNRQEAFLLNSILFFFILYIIIKFIISSLTRRSRHLS